MPATAIFDLDKTLTRKPTWSRYVMYVNAGRARFWPCAAMVLAHGAGHGLGLATRKAVKEHAMKTLAWAGRERLEDEAAAFIAQEVADRLRARAVELVDAHRARGDRLVLATAAVDLLGEPVARALGFDDVIATRIDWPDQPGKPPRVLGENCYGEEKLRRVQALDAQSPLPRPISVYSDHVSDLDLMRWADRGVAVNPSPALRAAAALHDVQIIDLDTETGLQV